MISLDLNSSCIRVLETNDGKIVSWASHPLEPDVFTDGMIEDTATLGKAIKDLMASSDIKGKKVVVGITGLYSLSRILVIPTPPATQLPHETIVSAIENTLPVTEDDFYFSWTTIGAVEGGSQVLVHAVPKEIIDDVMASIKFAGLSTQILDLAPMSLARAVNNDEGILLNIERDCFDIVLLVDGLAEIIRTSAWQHDDMSTEEKAEYLITAIETTVGFYDTSKPGYPFRKANPLIITGQMAENSELTEKIRNSFDFINGTIHVPFAFPESFSESQYAVNLGIAMKGLTIEEGLYSGYLTPEINLLPQRYKPWRPSRRQTYLGVATFIALAALFPVYQTTFEAIDETAQLDHQYTAINQLLELRKIEIGKRDPLRQVVDEYAIISSMTSDYIEDYEIITALADKLNVTISPITHNGNAITFSCEAENYIEFRSFLEALGETGRFVPPEISGESYPYKKSAMLNLVKIE